MQGIYPIRRFNLKLLIGIGVMMAVAGPLIVSAILSLRKVAHAQTEFLSHEAEELRLAQDLRCFIAEESAGMPVYVLTGDSSILQKHEQDGVKFDLTLVRLRQMVSEPENRLLLDTVREKHDELSKLGKPGILMRQNGASIEAVNAYFRSNTASLSESVIDSIQKFVDLTQQTFDREKEEILDDSSRDIEFLAFAAITAFFLLLLVGALLAKVVRQKYLYDRQREELLDRETLLSQARKETVEVVAHDLKNPLSSILLSTQMALDESENGNEGNAEDLRHALSITLRSAHSMELLIHNLLDHAKIEAGQLDMDVQPCDLAGLLRDVVDRFKPIAESKHVALAGRINPVPQAIELDSSRMEQVLSNLLGNALKFTPTGGNVTLGSTSADDQVTITVQDTGPGLTPEQTTHIFERYWQVRETARQGTGLGLSIAQAIVNAHGGTLKVASTPGRGSLFSITLPLKSPLQAI